MHKNFYASGFLYHPSTQQILLRQQKQTHNASGLWTLFGGLSLSNENAQTAFRRIIQKLLHVKLKIAAIEPVYSYFCKDIDKDHSVVYGKIEKMKNFSSKNGVVFSWFTFKQIHKLQLDERTRQDIIVGQRVIDSKERKRLGQKTLE